MAHDKMWTFLFSYHSRADQLLTVGNLEGILLTQNYVVDEAFLAALQPRPLSGDSGIFLTSQARERLLPLFTGRSSRYRDDAGHPGRVQGLR